MKKTTIIILIMAFPFLVFSQKRPKNKMKFGKIPMELFQMTSCDLDSTADAVIIGDFHNYSMDYYPNLGLKTTIEVYRRIKILNPDGVKELSDIEISLYQKGQNKDKLSKFKASTYNLENGEIVEIQLDKDSRFIEESGNWENRKYAFTNVKAGSVLEYHYIILSDYFEFPTYYPQQGYPVLWSELFFQYYEAIEFKYFVTGNSPVLYRNSERIQEKVSDTWIFQNVAPLKQDQFMGPVKNYRTKIEYELNRIEIPGVYYENYTTSWQEIAKDYLKSDHRGGLLDKSRYFKEIVEYVQSDTSAIEPMQKVQSALTCIRSQYLWNGKNSVTPTYEFNTVTEDKKGNSADMNILLIGSLRELGIISRPVIMSTRDNGWIMKAKPSFHDLNYLITSFDIDGKRYLVDAATSYSGIDALPSKCLNGEGLVLHETNSAWISLDAKMKYYKKVYVQASFDEDLVLSGTFQAKEEDYAGQYTRNQIYKEGSEEEVIEKEIKDLDEFEITDYQLTDVGDQQKAVGIKFHFKNKGILKEMGDLIHLEPILFKDFKENPFTKDHREFAVDFQFPVSLDYTYMYTLPEGFVVDELPKSTRVANADNSIVFILNTVSRGNTITVSLKFNIKKAIFRVDQYEDIKTFFDYFITQQKQPIILKSI